MIHVYALLSRARVKLYEKKTKLILIVMIVPGAFNFEFLNIIFLLYPILFFFFFFFHPGVSPPNHF